MDDPTAWPYARVAAAVDTARERVNAMRATLKRLFIQKDDVIDAMVVAACAGEPLLLVGEPGTGKSDLVVKFTEACGVEGHEYFEYMLTKFTEPNEILGPVDINELKQGAYIRRTAGKLPEARVAFLDEVFKSNSAILNTLLTILNERKFYQNGVPTPVALVVLFAATNAVPDLEELEALKDRFTLKVPCPPVRDAHFDELLAAGLRNELYRAFNERPWANVCALEDILIIKTFIERTMSGLTRDDADGRVSSELSEEALNPIELDRKLYFPEPVFIRFRNLIRMLEKDENVLISDRKVIKLYKLVRTRAFLDHGGEVQSADLDLVCYTTDSAEDAARVQEKVRAMLNM